MGSLTMLNNFNVEKREGTGGFLRPKDKSIPLSLRVFSSMETWDNNVFTSGVFKDCRNAVRKCRY
jgi:hypothetical protein